MAALNCVVGRGFPIGNTLELGPDMNFIFFVASLPIAKLVAMLLMGIYWSSTHFNIQC